MPLTLDPRLLRELAVGPGAPGGSIWRDPYVQRQLLAAHLDESTGAATRSPEAVERTLELLVDGLAPGSAVLDLGCGPGLYAQRLADRRFDVTGVDLNAASVAHARKHATAGVRYLEADYTQQTPTGPFALAILVYLDFGTHLPQVQRDLLREIHARLSPGGRLVFDHLDAPAAAGHTAGRDWQASATGGFRSADPYLLLSETSLEPGARARRTQHALLTGGDLQCFDVWEHCFDDQPIRALIAEAGFSTVDLHRNVLSGAGPQADDVVFAVATA